jgi:osmoprotectant transport system permease protein
MIPLLGIGSKPAVTALCIYGMMPMVRNTYTGVSTIDPDIIEVARGMGSTDSQILWR